MNFTTSSYAPVDIVVRAQASVGEGPFYDERTGVLSWVDILGGDLFETTLASGDTVRRSGSGILGAAIPREHTEGFVLATGDGFEIATATARRMVAPVLPDPAYRMNDAKCDVGGRLWAGSTSLTFEPGAGALHRWDGDNTSTVVVHGLTLPNGLGWTTDNRRMFLVDSLLHTVLVGLFDGDEGALGQLSQFASIPDGLPDGLAVDEEDCVWVAVWGASKVVRLSPDGRTIGVVEMPVSQPSSCCFGPDGYLYVTSARNGLDEATLRSEPLAGSVFAVQTGLSGAAQYRFGR